MSLLASAGEGTLKIAIAKLRAVSYLEEMTPDSRPQPSTRLRESLAGAELAAMNIPQVLGYAKIAGLPVVNGLYTLLFPLMAFAAVGSSQYLVVAADSATAALLGAGLKPLAIAGSAHYLELASMTALLTAIFLFLARIFKLGFLADFLSQTVLIGFLTGVGVQLAVGAFGEMLGLDINSRETFVQFQQIVSEFSSVHLPSALLASAIIVGVTSLSRWLPRFPGPLIAVFATLAASYFFNFAGLGMRLLGPVEGGLPSFSFPEVGWNEIQSLLPLAGSCCVMILAQSAATARFYASRHHQELKLENDLLGLSAANLAASLSGTFVVNGSPSQTAMLESSGGRKPWSHLATAITVAVILLLLTYPLQFLPRSALGAMVFLVGVRLIDWRGLSSMRRESPGEFGLSLITILIVTSLGVERGILIATAFSLLRIVWHSYHPHTGVMVRAPGGGWQVKPAIPGMTSDPGLLIYRFGAALFYANAGRFCSEIRVLLGTEPSPVRWVVIDAEAISQVDFSAARLILSLQKELRTRGIQLGFARTPPYLRSDLDRHHITAAIGEAALFPHLKDAVAAYEKDLASLSKKEI